ncbi:MAG: LysM peptidoglycan-binding domain-containing protein [Anaerolineales bacterium]|nr:LysM peptidoglycan-binding domain-containing protein [Anaerolineales bacterium]
MLVAKSKIWSLFAVLTILLAVAFSLPAPVLAADLSQQATPQPLPPAGEDGRILYTVQAGDSPWAISARFGIPLQTLQSLNNWGPDAVVAEGQVILLGLAEEPTATTDPQDSVVATATPEGPLDNPGTGVICVLLFDDVNGDAMRQETEFGISGGQASVSERTGLASRTLATQSGLDENGEPARSCFEDLPLGEYTISVAIPDGYNPTTAPNITIQIAPGQTQDINFGAQQSSSGGFNVLSPEEGGRSPLMGLLGIVLLLAGGGLGFYTLQLGRRR